MCWPFDALAGLIWMELRPKVRRSLRRLRRALEGRLRVNKTRAR